MWYAPTATTEPSAPISLEAVKRHVHAEDFTDDDGYLESLIAAAIDHVQKYCGAYFAKRTIEIKCDCFDDFVHVPLAPISSVTSIAYVDATGASQTLAATVYELRDDAIVLKYGQVWPPLQPCSRITVAAEVGFQECPASVQHAMLLWVADAYGTRESASTVDFSTMDALLSNHRYY